MKKIWKKVLAIIAATLIPLVITTIHILQPRWHYETDGSILSVSWSPDGNMLVAGGFDIYIYVFSRNGELKWCYETGWVRSVSWSPDSSMLAAGNRDGYVYVF